MFIYPVPAFVPPKSKEDTVGLEESRVTPPSITPDELPAASVSVMSTSLTPSAPEETVTPSSTIVLAAVRAVPRVIVEPLSKNSPEAGLPEVILVRLGLPFILTLVVASEE